VLCKLIFTACDFGRALENFAIDTVARHARKIFASTEHARISLRDDDRRQASPA
jgi:hypothetical protein